MRAVLSTEAFCAMPVEAARRAVYASSTSPPGAIGPGMSHAIVVPLPAHAVVTSPALVVGVTAASSTSGWSVTWTSCSALWPVLRTAMVYVAVSPGVIRPAAEVPVTSLTIADCGSCTVIVCVAGPALCENVAGNGIEAGVPTMTSVALSYAIAAFTSVLPSLAAGPTWAR